MPITPASLFEWIYLWESENDTPFHFDILFEGCIEENEKFVIGWVIVLAKNLLSRLPWNDIFLWDDGKNQGCLSK